jgi:SPX domain protein involved in polyphosphate accumulation
MKKNKLLKRYERKWVLNNIDCNQIFILLFRSNFCFSNQYEDRYVNSIYFDDQNFSSIKQNIDGISEKKKYRLRWYGDLNKILNPVFEIKNKNSFEVFKENINFPQIHGFDLFNTHDLKKIEELINNQFNFKNRILPILTTHYLRSYFISSNKLIRATVDRDLKSIKLYQNKNTSIVNQFNDIILELKYDLDLDDYVRSNFNNFSFRLAKNSKFINSATITPNTLS